MALITGILRDPANQAMSGVNISLHSLETSQTVLNTVDVSVTTAADGRYTLQVPAGFYSVSLNKTGHRSAQVGKFRVYDDSPSGDLNKFLKAPLTALTPEWFTRIEDERKKAEAEAADARASKLAAEAAVQQASDIAAQSQAHANQAKAEADRAAQVSGLDTVNQAVDAALAGQHVFAQNEVGLAVMRAMNLQRFAASGFVQWGRSRSGTALGVPRQTINQGMYSSPGNGQTNNVVMGDVEGNESPMQGQKSDTFYPVVHMAGFISKLKQLNNSFDTRNFIYLPPAPDGTVVYDRSTGESINYLTDVDPKYGDVAATKNEAISRAFEGMIKNGDFRLGGQHWGTSSGANVVFNESGLYLNEPAGSVLRVYQDINWDAYDYWEIEVNVSEVESGALGVNVYGTGSQDGEVFAVYTPGVYRSIVKQSDFDQEWGTDDRFLMLPKSGGFTGQVASVALRPIVREVVTARVDMFGLEGFLRKINLGDFVYPNGLIQSKATTMNGITTSNEAARPDSFFAVYDGDNSSRGLGVDFHARTLAEQDRLLADPDNNIFRMKSGDIVQWCIRQRSCAGAGNGDWSRLLNYASDIYFDDFERAFKAQGNQDSVQSLWGLNRTDDLFRGPYYSDGNFNPNFNRINGKGLFGAGLKAGINYAYNSECYFMVLGTVSRFNQGAYHETLNPFGAGAFINPLGTGAMPWTGDLLNQPTLMKHCFIKPTSAYPYQDGYQYPNNGNGKPIGSIGGGYSTRPDGRFYDAIYADGYGGVVDYRMSAHDVGSPQHAESVRQRVLNGQYRGLEKVLIKNQLSINQAGSDGLVTYVSRAQSAGHTIVAKTNSLVFHNGHVYQMWPHFNDFWVQIRRYVNGAPIAGDFTADIDLKKPFYFVPRGNVDLESLSQSKILERCQYVSVSGQFSLSEMIGNPNEILKVPELKNGWLGCWNPNQPGSELTEHDLSRKVVKELATQTYTKDSGLNWVSGNFSVDIENNMRPLAAGNQTIVCLMVLQAFAKQTRKTLVNQIYGGETGILPFSINMRHMASKGALTGESLLGVITKSQSGTTAQSLTAPVIRFGLWEDGCFSRDGSFDYPVHAELNLPAPVNSSDAVKILPFQAEIGGQATLNFYARQMVYDETAGDWGDSANNMVIVTGDSEGTDDNGHSIRFAFHTLAIPYGYTKNNS